MVDTALIASIITALASLVVGFSSFYIAIKLSKDKEKFDLKITEINLEYQKKIELIRSDLLGAVDLLSMNFNQKLT